MLKLNTVILLIFFYSLLIVGVSQAAQEEKQEEVEKRFSATASFSAIASSGNAKEFTFSLDNTNKFIFKKSELDLNVAAILSESDGERTSNLYTGYIKYNRNIRQNSYLTGLIGYESNTLAGFSNRYSLSLGLGHYIVKTKQRELQVEGGFGGVIEYTLIKEGGQTSPGSNGATTGKNKFLLSRAFIRAAFAISPSATFSQDAQFLFNMEESQDIRIYANSALTVKIVKHIALQMGLKIKYDNLPVPGYIRTDIITLSTIVISF